MKLIELSLSSVVRQLVGGMASKKGDGKDIKWRDSNACSKSRVKVEDSFHSEDESERSDDCQTLEQRLSPDKKTLASVKLEMSNNLDRSSNDDLDTVLKPLERLNINIEESAEKGESKINQRIEQDHNTRSNVGTKKPPEQSTKTATANQVSSGAGHTQKTKVSDVVASEISDTTLHIKKEPDEDESKPLSTDSRIGSKSDKFTNTRPDQSEAVCVTDTTKEEKLVSSKRHSPPTESDPAKPDSTTRKTTTDINDECNLESNKDYIKVLEAIKELKLRSSVPAEKTLSCGLDKHEDRAEEESETVSEKSDPNDTNVDEEADKIVMKFKIQISHFKEQESKYRNQCMSYKPRGPPSFGMPCGAGNADDSRIDSLVSVFPEGSLIELSANTVDDFFHALAEPLVPIGNDVNGGMMMHVVTGDSGNSDDSSASDSGLDDSSRFGDCSTPPTPHDSLVNRFLKDKLLMKGQGHATPMTSPSLCSIDSSMSSPYSMRDSPPPSYLSPYSPMDSPRSDQADITELACSIMSSRTHENGPHHVYMRRKFPGKPHCQGYSTSGPPNREPVLIGFLKKADKSEPDYQLIYQSARCYLNSHLALLYEEDIDGNTALYYAARLNKDERIVGFIVECLLEAQHKCSLINDSARSLYRIEEERYGKCEDNILHCLARWHSVRTNYILVAVVLFETCSTIHQLKFVRNNEGKFPYELCQAPDMWDMLGGPK